MNKKLVGIVLAVMLGIILIESYFLLARPNQPVSDVETPTDATSQTPISSSPKETSTELSNETSNAVTNSFIPAVPEFTVELVDTSYDVPTTYSTDPYTGKQVTHEGHHVARRTIEIRIKNQQFTPYTDSDGREIKFYYNVRVKGNYTEKWEGKTVYKPEQMPTQSNSEYTIISFNDVGDGGFYLAPAPRMLEVSPNGRVDFQVKALVGLACEGNIYFPSHFTGTESEWSATQTITIP